MQRRNTVHIVLLLHVLLLAAQCAAEDRSHAGVVGNAVIWTDPGDIGSHDLYWGPGGEKRKPVPPVEFVEEDRNATYAKFDVRDSAGRKWRVKMGIEAQPEVVASRLLWAVGYSANENYFLPHLHVDKLPPHLHRGQEFVEPGGNLSNVRLRHRPKAEKKVRNWSWRHNPFIGTREFNGLRVMMALLRNWDLYNDNNAILEDDSGRQFYQVSDVGTAFGAKGKHFYDKDSKNNLDQYRRGRLISKIKRGTVELHFPKLPFPLYFFDLPFYWQQFRAGWVGARIPRQDAKWIGSLLAQLSPDQIREAFRAGGYPPEQANAFTEVLISRIQELNRL